jgi:hypothetical protein
MLLVHAGYSFVGIASVCPRTSTRLFSSNEALESSTDALLRAMLAEQQSLLRRIEKIEANSELQPYLVMVIVQKRKKAYHLCTVCLFCSGTDGARKIRNIYIYNGFCRKENQGVQDDLP